MPEYERRITLTHLNVRQSIAILLTRLVAIDILLAIIVIGFYFLLVVGGEFTETASRSATIFLGVFTTIGIIKIGLTISTVLQWLFEYYEITPEAIVHKRGVFRRQSERYSLDKVRAIQVHDTFLGEMFNYATISVYDLRLNKYLDMYLIHNPNRYEKILRTLHPGLEKKSDRIVLPIMPKREDEEEEERD